MDRSHQHFSRCLLMLALAGLAAGTSVAVAGPIDPDQALRQRVVKGEEAKVIARQKGWNIRVQGADGSIAELDAIVNGLPQYLSGESNAMAAQTIRVDRVRPGLTGAGITVGEWDEAGVRGTHQELTGRVTQVDSPSYFANHSTHVAGTIGASGAQADAKGMAPAVRLRAFDWNNRDAEIGAEAAAGMQFSNHSYGYRRGWYRDSFNSLGHGANAWHWYGDTSVSTSEEATFGLYNEFARDFDLIAQSHPNHLIVKSAGNDRNDAGPAAGGQHWVQNASGSWISSTATRQRDGGTAGFDSIADMAVAKNVITVGAVADVPSYVSASSVAMSGFSGFGPTDDGRIKPDVVANGVGLRSSVAGSDAAYDTYDGTSMASPCVTGALALLAEKDMQVNRIRLFLTPPPGPIGPPIHTLPIYLWTSNHITQAATYKGLLIHTADECGSAAGPDYQFGWGLVNVERAANLIGEDAATRSTAIQELTLNNGETFSTLMVSSDFGTGRLTNRAVKVTICWTDPAGVAQSLTLDPTTRALVNDLDLRIEQTPSSLLLPRPLPNMPWILNPASPANPATRGDNTRDNVEQVAMTASSIRSYRIVVRHKGSLAGGSQKFSMLITGLQPLPASTALRSGDTSGNDAADRIAPQMLFNFLADYFAEDERADFNLDGRIDAKDVFEFLEFYLTGQ